jgi:hypothetical protein
VHSVHWSVHTVHRSVHTIHDREQTGTVQVTHRLCPPLPPVHTIRTSRCTHHSSSLSCFTLRHHMPVIAFLLPPYAFIRGFHDSRSLSLSVVCVFCHPVNKRPPWRSLLPLNPFISGLVAEGTSAVFANSRVSSRLTPSFVQQ